MRYYQEMRSARLQRPCSKETLQQIEVVWIKNFSLRAWDGEPHDYRANLKLKSVLD